jgi:membrane protease YdiL (CAAX protease family)
MFQVKKNKLDLSLLLHNQKLWISFLAILACLFLELTFPVKNSAQLITKNIFFLVIFPVVYIRVMLKEPLSNFGFNLKENKIAAIWGSGLGLFLLATFFLLIHYSGFHSGYKLSTGSTSNFWLFLFYELLIVNFTIFINEIFFRGFLFFLLEKEIGYWAIFVQAIIYFLMLLLINSLSWQTIPFILFAITGGVLAYKTKSFLYSYFLHIFVIIILDSYLIYLSR